MNRIEAELKGLKVYEGRPCKKGHTERLVSNKACVACNRQRAAEERDKKRGAAQ